MSTNRVIEVLKAQIEINREWCDAMNSAEDKEPFEEIIKALEIAIESIELCEEHVVSIPLGERRAKGE